MQTFVRVVSLPDLVERPADAHKGTFGRAFIVGGSRGMSGAAALAGLGALRSGAGLVCVGCPQEIQPVVASIEPSYLTVPLPQDAAGRLAASARKPIDKQLESSTALAIGPGLGLSKGIAEIVTGLYVESPIATVLDADALTMLSRSKKILSPGAKRKPAAPRILTPHPGEFARLIGTTTEQLATAREELAAEFAHNLGVVVVLKGRHTVITDGARLAVNSTGNSGMATGGTGDVLTGVIVALLAQGMAPFDAAQLGVHWHGLAGDLAAAEISEPSLIASDLPRYLGRAYQEMRS